MKLKDLIEAKRAEIKSIIEARDGHLARQRGIITNARNEGRDRLTQVEQSDFDSARESAASEEKRFDAATRALDELERAQADEEQNEREQEQAKETGAAQAGQARAYDSVARVGQEERTYAAHKERGFDQNAGKFRRTAKPGAQFEHDVAAAFLGDYEAQERLRTHMQEERVERGDQLKRATTGAFAGLVVPQYLTDLYAPKASPKRPFADICNHHDLPADGMTLNISRITTSTSVDEQSTENTAVDETDIDDTLLTVNVLTNAGQQTLSRQAVERGTGTESVTMDDLYRQYAATLDSKLINRASIGLTNVATAITYTDTTPTVAEFLPLTSQAASAVETALLDQASGETVAIMHSRRWFWINQALSTSHPLLNQPGASGSASGVNYGEMYGRGFRGLLPNGVPVVTDNNIAINLGGGTNQDEVYFVDPQECHLWEDPNAPMFIRAEQTKAASLGILLVLYGYYGFTAARMPHAQKVSGTGLVTPTWTGA